MLNSDAIQSEWGWPMHVPRHTFHNNFKARVLPHAYESTWGGGRAAHPLGHWGGTEAQIYLVSLGKFEFPDNF